MIGRHALHLGALSEYGVDGLAQRKLARHRDDRAERVTERAVPVLCGARDHRVEGRLAQQRLPALVKHGEMRRHLRFEREALQQALAEAVNGVDLEPAFGFERPGEQASRVAQVVFFRRAPEQQDKLFAQRLLGHRSPLGKIMEQAVLHLRRRRLGVGQAENRFGSEAREQES